MIPLLAKLHGGPPFAALVGVLEILLATGATLGRGHHSQTLKRDGVAAADALTEATVLKPLSRLLYRTQLLKITRDRGID